VEFFSTLPRNNDLSITAHSAMACFLAAQQVMLEKLRELQGEELNGQQLLRCWHNLMEPTGGVRSVPDSPEKFREKFFTEVIHRANSVSCLILFFA
jgi:hypothetical protein